MTIEACARSGATLRTKTNARMPVALADWDDNVEPLLRVEQVLVEAVFADGTVEDIEELGENAHGERAQRIDIVMHGRTNDGWQSTQSLRSEVAFHTEEGSTRTCDVRVVVAEQAKLTRDDIVELVMVGWYTPSFEHGADSEDTQHQRALNDAFEVVDAALEGEARARERALERAVRDTGAQRLRAGERAHVTLGKDPAGTLLCRVAIEADAQQSAR